MQHRPDNDFHCWFIILYREQEYREQVVLDILHSAFFSFFFLSDFNTKRSKTLQGLKNAVKHVAVGPFGKKIDNKVICR